MYFSVFFVCFSLSLLITHISSIPTVLRDHWLPLSAFCCAWNTIVHINTIFHPYLMADNRHYIFYIYNKFYKVYWWARYSMVPAATFAFLILYRVISHQTAGFQVMFTICTVAVLGFQQLIEFRYFIMPFLILRLVTPPPKTKWLIIDFILYIIVNAAVFYTFVTKEIYWENYDTVQRLMW